MGCRVRKKNREEIGAMKVLYGNIYVLENYLWKLGRERIGERTDQRRGKYFGGHYNRWLRENKRLHYSNENGI